MTKEDTVELYIKVINKLVGPINPVASSEIDEERLNNLEILCKVVDRLVTDIDNVSYRNKDACESSRLKAADYAKKFLSETLGIKE